MKKSEKMINIKENSNYTGNVKVEIIDNGVLRDTIVAHNTGTIDICRYLRDAMAGDYIIADRPGTIVPCTATKDSITAEVGGGTALFNAMPKKFDTEDQTTISSSCVLTFLIPSNALSSTTEIGGFRLYSKNEIGRQMVLYAEVNLLANGLSPIYVESGTNLKVTWTLTVRIA